MARGVLGVHANDRGVARGNLRININKRGVAQGVILACPNAPSPLFGMLVFLKVNRETCEPYNSSGKKERI